MNPMFSWAGSKRRILRDIKAYMPLGFCRKGSALIEPFAGGAALTFDFEPDQGVLLDTNVELMRTYKAVRDEPKEVYLNLIKQDPSKRYFDKIKNTHPNELSDSEVAARLLFLIKCSFGSLYRVNKQGLFNVPYAKPQKKMPIYSYDDLLKWSKILKKVVLVNGDFSRVLDYVKPKDIVYFDPPYHKEEAFYSFSYDDHKRLASVYRRCVDTGAYCVLSLGEDKEVLDFYDRYRKYEMYVFQGLSKDPNRRRYREEHLVVGY